MNELEKLLRKYQDKLRTVQTEHKDNDYSQGLQTGYVECIETIKKELTIKIQNKVKRSLTKDSFNIKINGMDKTTRFYIGQNQNVYSLKVVGENRRIFDEVLTTDKKEFIDILKNKQLLSNKGA